MKIVKAQKKIAHLKGEIKELRERAKNCVCTLKGNSPYLAGDFSAIMAVIFKKVEELISLKTRIIKINVEKGVFEKIATLGELRSQVVFLRELDIKEGIVAKDYQENSREYVSQLSEAQKNEMIEETQKKIETLMEELDDFNAEHSI